MAGSTNYPTEPLESNGKPSGVSWQIVLSTIATIISLAALSVGINNCQNSRKNAELALQRYQASQTFTWNATPLKEWEFSLRPSNPAAVVYEVTAYFPSTLLGKYSIARVAAPDFKVSFARLVRKIEERVRASLKTDGDGVYMTLPKSVPVAFRTEYVVDGTHYVDQSIYTCNFWVQVEKDPDKEFKEFNTEIEAPAGAKEASDEEKCRWTVVEIEPPRFQSRATVRTLERLVDVMWNDGQRLPEAEAERK